MMTARTRRSAARCVLMLAMFAEAGLITACEVSTKPAQEILRRTIPPGDTAPTLADAVSSEGRMQVTWDFESHFTAAQYADWLRAQLRDFDVIPSDPAQMQFSKLIGGDSYRLLITLQAGPSTTRVHAQLTASPG